MDPVITLKDADSRTLTITTPMPSEVQDITMDFLEQSKAQSQARLVQIPIDKQASADAFDVEVVTVTDQIAKLQAMIDQGNTLIDATTTP